MLRRTLAATSVMTVLVLGGTVPPASAETHTISTPGTSFSPATITVQQGDTVVWSIEGGVHTVTSDEGAFDSGFVNPGGTFSRTFDTPGVVGYHCTLHGGPSSGMAGQIIVQAPTTTTTTTTTPPVGGTTSTTVAGSPPATAGGTGQGADPAAEPAGPELARTGRGTAPTAWVGAALITAGSLAIAASRRRRARP